MKYRIGQGLVKKIFLNVDENYEPDCEIVCVAIFDGGIWKYGVKEDMAEYGNMVDFYTEEELEKEFVVGGKE